MECTKRNSIERFELINKLYYNDTGYLRPGKSDPLYNSSSPENLERFEHWLVTKAWWSMIDSLIDAYEKIEELEEEVEEKQFLLDLKI